MVNLGFNLAAIIGLFDILGAVCYLILVFISIRDWLDRVISTVNLIFTAFCGLIVFLSGIILVFNAWRLDPILMIQQLCLHVIVYVLGIK